MYQHALLTNLLTASVTEWMSNSMNKVPRNSSGHLGTNSQISSKNTNI